MVDSLFQGFGSGMGGTHNAVLSSAEYLSTAGKTPLRQTGRHACLCVLPFPAHRCLLLGCLCLAVPSPRPHPPAHTALPARLPPALRPAARSFNNIEDGFYISPAFLDKLSIHVAKNFLDLPKIKVPLILGIWGGKGQGEWAGRARLAGLGLACVGS